jgi:hypothetical protein
MEMNGLFQITDWQESVEKQGDDGTKLSIALVKQTYSGDINGVSEVKYQLFYDKSGDAIFNGFEIITLNPQSEQASIVLKHEGKFVNGSASSQFTVIHSSMGEQWAGKKGHFTSAEGGKANYLIT